MIGGLNLQEIQFKEKNRIFHGKVPKTDQYRFEKKYFWYLWSDRCQCKGKVCGEIKLDEQQRPVNMTRCKEEEYKGY